MTGKWTIRASTQDSVNNDPSPASISLNLFASSYPRAVLSSNLLNFPGHCACSLWKTCEAVDLSWLVLGTGFYWSTNTCQLKSSRIDVGFIFALSRYNLESFSIWHIFHRCDSIQGTDCIANSFFLNSRVSKTKIENVRWQVGSDIIQVTSRKFVTLLVQKRIGPK